MEGKCAEQRWNKNVLIRDGRLMCWLRDREGSNRSRGVRSQDEEMTRDSQVLSMHYTVPHYIGLH